MNEIDSIKNRMKNKKCIKNNIKSPIIRSKLLLTTMYKFLITIFLVLTILVLTKNNDKYKSLIKQNVFEKNISFAYINNLYKKYFGEILPFKEINFFDDSVQQTFNEELKFSETSKYLDGVKLIVDNNYLIPIQESGLVVFSGEKDEYGNIVIIQQTNGIDMWYCNITNLNVNLYDYVEKGTLLGESNGNEIYLVYQKDGKFLDYEEYIKKD